ncbi:MAG: DUF368 domain-containing protein [Anaerolineae bacterium]
MNLEANRLRIRQITHYVGIAARGFCMGAADIVPGVSGGTMAFILGIYERLIEALHAIGPQLVRQLLRGQWRAALHNDAWPFLISLGLGIGAAVITLARVLSWALDQHASLVWAFFFGLVLASIIVVRRRVTRWGPANIAAAIATAVGAFWLVGRTALETPNEPWFLFLSGMLAICAMILPGISGAFILVLLGKYETVLAAIVHRDVLTLAIIGAGCAVGLFSFVRLLRWLLVRHHDMTVAMLTGLMAGSLRKVWPWKEASPSSTGLEQAVEINRLPTEWSPEVALTIALIFLGIGLVLGIEHLSGRSTPGSGHSSRLVRESIKR